MSTEHRPIRISPRVDATTDIARVLCDHDADFPCDACWQACYNAVLDLSKLPAFQHLNRKV